MLENERELAPAVVPVDMFVELACRAYQKAFAGKILWFNAYGSKERGFHVEATDDNGGFIVCDQIPELQWAKMIAASLNAVARTKPWDIQ